MVRHTSGSISKLFLILILPVAPIWATVNSIVTYDNMLVVGGSFSSINGATYPGLNNIAAWNDVDWISLGDINGPVYALIVYDGDLIAGGDFTLAGGIAVSNIAVWNGTVWSGLGDGINGDVRTLAVYNGDLVAGGQFSMAGGTEANSIASWNGSSWAALGDGLNASLLYWAAMAMTVYDGNLIVGGDFNTAGGIAANKIASWNGSSWSTLGSGITGQSYYFVRALQVDGTNLLVGGYFFQAGGINVKHFAVWNGSSWSGLGSAGWTSALHSTAITLYDSEIILGFNSYQDDDALYHWTGSAWPVLGGGVWQKDPKVAFQYEVSALMTYEGKLIVGGWFTGVGSARNSIYVDGLAAWDGSSWSTIGDAWSTDVEVIPDNKMPQSYSLAQNYPNPFNPSTDISFSLPRRSTVNLTVYNLLGRKIETLINKEMEAGNYTALWDGSNSASGIYFYRLSAGDYVETKKMLLLK